MGDLAGTYFVQDRANQEELKRLIVQERMATDAMGGVLPEQEDPTRFQRVLDIYYTFCATNPTQTHVGPVQREMPS